MSNYSNESANIPCQKCLDKKVIYLTFDDGPEPGTISIYNKLKSLRIPATFFMVGENVIAHETGVFKKIGINMKPTPGLFKHIFNDPLFQIGNHSQTQSHQFYPSYYKSGLRIDSTTLAPSADSTKPEGRRSVLVDFELASIAFTHALNSTPEKYFEDRKKIIDYNYRGNTISKIFSDYGITYFRFLTGRLPGTNRWRIPNKTSSEWDWGGPDRDDEADDLYKNDYRIYGWNLEWQMTNETSVMSDDVNKEHLKGEDGWWDGYYAKENEQDDRLEQSVETMFSKVNSYLDGYIWSKKQCVILLHDRQFRPNIDGSNPYVEKLEQFIKKCQDKGYTFDVLENY